MMREISTMELKSRMDQGHRFVLLDVRGDGYFDKEHIPGAISAPVGHIGEGIECCVIKGAELVTYSTNGKCTLSEEGVRRLQGLGFTNILRYRDGLQGWKDAGLRTVVMREKKQLNPLSEQTLKHRGLPPSPVFFAASFITSQTLL